MIGITWNEKRKKWRLQYANIDKYYLDINKSICEMLNLMCAKNQKKIKIDLILHKSYNF